ncbi:MAG: hypothetical protein HOL92_06910 [Opitutales bacterium]|nr:hypothetical protein [Opitutales bacterium]
MKPERIDELIQKCVLGIQTDSEAQELSDHLERDDSKAARRKLRLALKADAYLQEAAAELGDESHGSESTLARKVTSLKRQLWTQGGIAAAIAIGFFAWFFLSGAPRAESELGVATVLRIEGQGLANQDRTLARGDALQAGDELKMEQGLVELVFTDTGVHAIATAPLFLTANSSKRIFLHNGDVKLTVPPQGIGFVVETAEREITDLGTSFVVTAVAGGSKVFVLDGEISLGKKNGIPARLMRKGEIAHFGRLMKPQELIRKVEDLPALSLDTQTPSAGDFSGIVLGFEEGGLTQALSQKEASQADFMGKRIAPLLVSKFHDRSGLDGLRQSNPLRFGGIAGSYRQYPEKSGLTPYSAQAGWITWYNGKVAPPSSGRYRFWGYADNHLIVAIDGNPVFDGSRYDSSLRQLSGIIRENHPDLPCINAPAGFASGPWIELGDDSIQLDILFGELSGNKSFGLLLVEREGEAYAETFWGQPKWPIFLTEAPNASHRSELEKIRDHMEKKLAGSFSVSSDSIWTAASP